MATLEIGVTEATDRPLWLAAKHPHEVPTKWRESLCSGNPFGNYPAASYRQWRLATQPGTWLPHSHALSHSIGPRFETACAVCRKIGQPVFHCLARWRTPI